MVSKKLEHFISKYLTKMDEKTSLEQSMGSLRKKISQKMGRDVSLDEINKCLDKINNDNISGMDEFIDGDGSFINGDFNPNNREAFVGINRPETSREFSMFTSQGPRYYYTPHYGASKAYTRENVKYSKKTIAENKMKNMIEDLINNKSNNYDVIDNFDYDKDSIPELNHLKSKHQRPIIARKTKYLGDMIEREGASGEEIAIVINHLLSNVDVKSIPGNYIKILINKLKHG